MNYRERFQAVLNHKKPDRMPADLCGTCLTSCHEKVLDGLVKYNGIIADSKEEAYEKLYRLYDVDFRHVGVTLDPNTIYNSDHKSEGWYVDGWGVKYRYTGHYWEICNNPLRDATFDEIKSYKWPDLSMVDTAWIDKEAERTKRLYYDTDYVLIAEHPVFGYFELACWMFGFDDFLYRMIEEPEVAEYFFEKYHNYVVQLTEYYYEKLGPYIHLTTSGDDFGTQNGPFLSPQLFADMIVPWYKKRIALTKQVGKIPYFHHSCGSVYRLMDSLIEMGVDVLNPIQPGAFEMEPERLKNAYGDKIVFWGGIDEQHLLSKASPEEVVKEAKRVTEILNKDGGYVMAASHNIQEDVPCQNVDALFKMQR